MNSIVLPLFFMIVPMHAMIHKDNFFKINHEKPHWVTGQQQQPPIAQLIHTHCNMPSELTHLISKYVGRVLYKWYARTTIYEPDTSNRPLTIKLLCRNNFATVYGEKINIRDSSGTLINFLKEQNIIDNCALLQNDQLISETSNNCHNMPDYYTTTYTLWDITNSKPLHTFKTAQPHRKESDKLSSHTFASDSFEVHNSGSFLQCKILNREKIIQQKHFPFPKPILTPLLYLSTELVAFGYYLSNNQATDNGQKSGYRIGFWNTVKNKIASLHTSYKAGFETMVALIFTRPLLATSQNKFSGASWAIDIWDPKNGACINTLSGHTNGVASIIELFDNMLASASEDATIKIWNYLEGKCLRTLTGHEESVTVLKLLSSGNLASGSYGGIIKVWDILHGTCLQTFPDPARAIVSYIGELSGGQLITSTANKCITIWDGTTEPHSSSLL